MGACGISRDDITGLVLAGGQGSRMGGVDKGLQLLDGQPLARLALQRLQPQVGALLLSANRHQDVYAHWGVPVLPDAQAGYPGPLAGMAAGLATCTTGWLLCVPCDAPFFPADLARRLADAAWRGQADIALASAPEAGADGQPRLRAQPVFCLLNKTLLPALNTYLHQGGRKVGQWLAQQRAATEAFDRPGDDPQAFANINTLQALERLHRTAPLAHHPIPSGD